MKRRILSLFLPIWATDRVLRRWRQQQAPGSEVAYAPGSVAGRLPGGHAVPAVVLWQGVAERQLISRCCARATRAGITPGMPLAQARALWAADSTATPATGNKRKSVASSSVSQLIDQQDAPERDQRALAALAQWVLERYSPSVALDPPDGLLLDITGCDLLFHGERGLAIDLLDRLDRLGVHARAAIAPTIGAAWALARFQPTQAQVDGLVHEVAQMNTTASAVSSSASSGRSRASRPTRHAPISARASSKPHFSGSAVQVVTWPEADRLIVLGAPPARRHHRHSHGQHPTEHRSDIPASASGEPSAPGEPTDADADADAICAIGAAEPEDASSPDHLTAVLASLPVRALRLPRRVVKSSTPGQRASSQAAAGFRGMRTATGSPRGRTNTPAHDHELDIHQAGEIEERLAAVGITTIGDVLNISRASLAARYGDILRLRVDQALGLAFEGLQPIRSETPIEFEQRVDGATRNLAVVQTLAECLLDRLIGELEQRESGVRRLVLRVDRLDLEPFEEVIPLSRPTRNRRHLQSLLRPRLEHLHLGFGVEGMRLTVDRIGRMRHRQWKAIWSSEGAGGDATHCSVSADHDDDEPGDADRPDHRRHPSAGSRPFGGRLISGGPNDAGLGELVDQLADRLGWIGVQRAMLRERHVPERSVEQHDLETWPTRGPRSLLLQHDVNPRFEQEDVPTRLYAVPQPIQVMALTPDGPVLRLRRPRQTPHEASPTMMTKRGREFGRRDASAAHPMVDADITITLGPHRIGATWWDGKRAEPKTAAVHVRDYFKVQDTRGRWLWIFRDDRTNRWFLHGEWV